MRRDLSREFYFLIVKNIIKKCIYEGSAGNDDDGSHVCVLVMGTFYVLAAENI